MEKVYIINNQLLISFLVKKPLITQLASPESIMGHVPSKTSQANTPVNVIGYKIEEEKVIRCLVNKNIF